MKPLEMQPTFTLTLPGSGDGAIGKLRQAIKTPDLKGLAVSAGRCVDFKIETANQRFWSPHLSIQVSETEQGTELFGRFSPRPEIWTLFMVVYFAAAFCIGIAGIYGYVQWLLGLTPWALVAIPISSGLIAVLHGASLIGQRLSSDQMRLLRRRLDLALDIAFDQQESPRRTGVAESFPPSGE